MKHILFLMSDTGGGHRAAAEAIRDALYIRYGEDNISAVLVDVFKQYTNFPLKYQPELYPIWVNRGKSSWGMGYKLSNTRRSAALLSRGMYLTNSGKLRRMVKQHPADVVVCVHSVIARPSLRAYMSYEQRPPFITVVTDLVSTHVFWYDRRVDRCLVPTQAAYDRGLKYGLKPEQMRITGLPVHPHFTQQLTDKATARAQLGWSADLPTILMVAGGEGMGPIYETARAINERRLNCQLVIIAGKNKPLKAKLDKASWHQTTHIYPFVRNMPQMMAAADILVTKAGPATISEACIAGLPMILSDAIPGQEDGNVQLVVESGAGVYAPKPEEVAQAVAEWLDEGIAGLQKRAENARKIAHPNAVWDIADEVWSYAHQGPIATGKRPRKNLRMRLKSTMRQLGWDNESD